MNNLQSNTKNTPSGSTEESLIQTSENGSDDNPILKEVTTQFLQHDDVEHPQHYKQLPSGIEAIDITEHFNFNLGNALKYIIRSGHKGQTRKDLEKARWYVNRELERINKYGH